MKKRFNALMAAAFRQISHYLPKFIVLFVMIPSMIVPQFAWAATGEVLPGHTARAIRPSMAGLYGQAGILPDGYNGPEVGMVNPMHPHHKPVPGTLTGAAKAAAPEASSRWCPTGRSGAGFARLWNAVLVTVGIRADTPFTTPAEGDLLAETKAPTTPVRPVIRMVDVAESKESNLEAAARASMYIGRGVKDLKVPFSPMPSTVADVDGSSTSAGSNTDSPGEDSPGGSRREDLGAGVMPNPMRALEADAPEEVSGAGAMPMARSALRIEVSAEEVEGEGAAVRNPLHVARTAEDSDSSVGATAPSRGAVHIRANHKELTLLLQKASVYGAKRVVTPMEEARLQALLQGYTPTSTGWEAGEEYPELLKALQAYKTYLEKMKKKGDTASASNAYKDLLKDMERLKDRKALNGYGLYLAKEDVDSRGVYKAIAAAVIAGAVSPGIIPLANLLQAKIIQGLAVMPDKFYWLAFDPVGIAFKRGLTTAFQAELGIIMPVVLVNSAWEALDRMFPDAAQTAMQREYGRGSTIAKNVGVTLGTAAKAFLIAYMFYSRNVIFDDTRELAKKWVGFLGGVGLVMFASEFNNLRTKLEDTWYAFRNPSFKQQREDVLQRLAKVRKTLNHKSPKEIAMLDREMRAISDSNMDPHAKGVQLMRKLLKVTADGSSGEEEKVKKPSFVRRIAPYALSAVIASGFAYALGITFEDSFRDFWNFVLNGKIGQTLHQTIVQQYATLYQYFADTQLPAQFDGATRDMLVFNGLGDTVDPSQWDWFTRCIKSWRFLNVGSNGVPVVVADDDDPTDWYLGDYNGWPGCPGVIDFPGFSSQRFLQNPETEFYYNTSTPETLAQSEEAASALFDSMQSLYHHPNSLYGSRPDSIYRTYVRNAGELDLLKPNRTIGFTLSPAAERGTLTLTSLGTMAMTGAGIAAATGMLAQTLDIFCSRHPKTIIPGTRLRNGATMLTSMVQGVIDSVPLAVSAFVLIDPSVPDEAKWFLLSTAVLTNGAPAVMNTFRALSDGPNRIKAAWRHKGEAWPAIKRDIASTRVGALLGNALTRASEVPGISHVLYGVRGTAGVGAYVYHAIGDGASSAAQWFGATRTGQGLRWLKNRTLGPSIDPLTERYDTTIQELMKLVPSMEKAAIAEIHGLLTEKATLAEVHG